MDARTLAPANGGLVVLQDTNAEFGTAPDAAIFLGEVLARGNGVPWVGVGARVAFRPERAAYLTVDPQHYAPLKGKPVLCTSDGGAIVVVLDQRDILTVLDDPFPGMPGVAAGPAQD